MEHEHFYPPHAGVSLKELAEKLGAELLGDGVDDRVIRSVAPVSRAKKTELCYILSRRNKAELETCDAGAVLCDAAIRSLIPAHIPVLMVKNPHAAFALAGQLLHPEAQVPLAISKSDVADVSPAAFVDPSARLEVGVAVEPMAVIGADVEIGAGTRIGAGAVIGRGVKIGRDCSIAAGASVIAAYIGNGVIIHNGVRIGQDGFGYAPGPRGMVKIVQIGRVIIQDHVEIGANTTIDRGTMDDTVIGEGTKIDNQVQIGHNVRIGRHCGIVAQVGIAGSTVIGDGVLIGGGSGVNGHIKIGDGVQIAAMSGVVGDLPAGEKFGGIPARPLAEFLRDCAEVMTRSESRSKARKGQK
ncbi:UDP-3-O-(3-hydroxymyristoyl)glucosamine N-acyltransferase [Rhizobium sp.]|jgi:UDP-3-O-[3-hydroxymyristoyl] glucosamine N-acyltransferase|uniref:UDP-3-O-(3-hydroxymyristoyl)glucosamine N-acyltransferase n=1 Tax=Rhizobium sp. TaxID=391 RepID=UPI000E818E9B|nr:UDP-3-O-(3-hydroxymyristoyl)glucosamine N-acyltransferase [Rhizobium sp.]